MTRVTPEVIGETRSTYPRTDRARLVAMSVDSLGQEGQPSSPAWCGKSYRGFFDGEWHQ